MHATAQELIALRDGELVSADVVQHAAECAECHAEFARLRRVQQALRELPGFAPPAYDAAGLAFRLGQRKSRSVARWNRVAAPLAVASMFVVAFVTLERGAPPSVAPVAVEVREPSAAVQQLMARSRELETALEELPQRPAVERVATSATIDALQSRIQLLDAQLSGASDRGLDPEQSRELWNSRVQLLNSLVSVRYAEAARDAYPTATRGVI